MGRSVPEGHALGQLARPPPRLRLNHKLKRVAEESSGVRSLRDEAIPGRLSRPLAAGPGRRAGTSGGRPHLWRHRPDDPPLAAATPGDRHGCSQASAGTAAPHWPGHRAGAAGPGGDPPRRHAGRALCRLGGDPGRHHQHGHHVARLGAAGLAAQKKSLIAAERDAAARAAWREGLAAIAPQRFVFLDETATPTSLTRLRARAPRGERAIGTVPRRRWQSVTLLASVSTRGMGAAMVLDGAINREAFEAYVEQSLLPTLLPGQIVILDNLAVHKSPRARRLIEGAGCQLRFLPSYSPDFNPIELAFAKLKQTLRGAAERTFLGLVAATGPALEAITPADARGFFAHSGYHLSGQLL